ncbi:HAMP domain-containing sensor histidine kinase [Paraburkholderia sp. DHOC27]|uniref:sensor histidine kinase n=1 Tax=Paraburkholderia sp. DHOC27 TaxID=2303330 RepID=UPI000E3C91A9|nr:HAMP domain-containing sensor histidine kinase [Paraburkholderia sp. DHOC27]RFU45160.1 sensor histidine kinase [Paraburkholderia sp. DHOC27]
MKSSLRNNLVIALGILVSVVAIAQGISSYQLCRAGMSALLDLRLEQVAVRMHNGFASSIPATPERGSQPVRDIVITIHRPGAEVPLRSTDPALQLPEDAAAGFSSEDVNGEEWRIYTLRDPGTLIQVAQRSSVRNELERETAMTTLWPTLVLLPLVLGAVLLIVQRSLRKMNQLGNEVQDIDASHLKPLPVAGVPSELLPFVGSINRMIERLAQSMEAERKFIADAAHELRTPLTALQLQADNLQPHIVASNQERFKELRGGIARSGALISQLLRLARADAPVLSSTNEATDVAAIVVAAVSEVLPLAAARGIDIGAEEMSTDKVAAPGADVAVAVKNLVSNAVRYTPDGGTIDLCARTEGNVLWVEVRDTGPGIAPELLPRVFDRFFRANVDVEGTGLGLSIVKAITGKYGGEAVIRNRDDGQTGIVAAVSFPLAQAAGVAAATRARRVAEQQNGSHAQGTAASHQLHGRDA